MRWFNFYFGGSGDDTITTGDGNDVVISCSGDDVITTNGGNDKVYSGRGNDTIDTGDGHDYVSAGQGNDTVYGGAGCDLLKGGSGNDVINGGDGNDLLLGQWGHDSLYGGAGRDLIFAGSHDDMISGGSGNDLVFGGSGNDTARYSVNDNIGAHDYYNGGSGIDTLLIDFTGVASYAPDIEHRINNLFNNNPVKVDFSELGIDGFDLIAIKFENIEVILPNLAPEASDDTAVTNEDTSINIDVLANDIDPDGDPLTITEASVDFGNVNITPEGELTYSPTADYNGEAVINYTISDSQGETSSATATITVVAVNDAPIAQNDAFVLNGSPTLQGNLFSDNGNGVDFDIDGDILSITQINNTAYTLGNTIELDSGAELTINQDGSFTYENSTQSSLPSFTGDAAADFSGLSNTVSINDGMDDLLQWSPQSSGWDINQVHMVYDSENDTLYTGIDTFGILGDVDGDGGEASSSLDLLIRGGQDIPNLGQSESFQFIIDTVVDGQFNPDYVVGVSHSSDLTSFNLYEVDSYNQFIVDDFGNIINSGNSVELFNTSLDSNTPDLEFSINNFAQTLGIDVSDGFELAVFAGSFQDDGIGEDFVGNQGAEAVSLQNAVNSSDAFSYTVVDPDGLEASADVSIDLIA